MYTASQIEQIIYSAYRKSASIILGLDAIPYKSDTRIGGEGKETISIKVQTGTADRVQEGILNLNYFVPDVIASDGRNYKNGKRCAEIEEKMTQIAEAIMSYKKYAIYLEYNDMIQTYSAEEEKEHFINVNLRFKVFNK